MKKWMALAAVFCGIAAVLDCADRAAKRPLSIWYGSKAFSSKALNQKNRFSADLQLSFVRGNYLRRALSRSLQMAELFKRNRK